jgi:quercetin 2,3-dioxygenase
MIKQSKGRIFLTDERGLNETKWFRSQNTFNFGKFQNENKEPFGKIYLLNDDMLAGGRSLSMLVEDDSYVILLPLAGAINCKKENTNETLVAAGQVLVHSINSGRKIEISNPFKEEAINFLQIWIRAREDKKELDDVPLTYDDVNEDLNQLINIFPIKNDLQFSISIGKFSGRGETVYKPTGGNGCFLFVLEGAFEAEGRLLHERDGLALWDTDDIEIEALSNDAIMLLIETTL